MAEKIADRTIASLYPLEFEGNTWSLLKMPDILFIPEETGKDKEIGGDIYNIIMADTSMSMVASWDELVKPWNEYVAHKLIGRCDTYIFSSEVVFARNTPELKIDDYIGEGTDLLGAIQTIKRELDKCTEKNIKVFLLTDGHGKECPNEFIQSMVAPVDKTIEVFVIAFGRQFPVNYSVDIRAKLHNGSIDIPFIFWAEVDEEVKNILTLVSTYIVYNRISCQSSHPGTQLPGYNEGCTFYLREWILLKESPEILQNELIIQHITIDMFNRNSTKVEIICFDALEYDIVSTQVFSQWNSCALHVFRKGGEVDGIVFRIMESLFKIELERLKALSDTRSDGIEKRLHEKKIKTIETTFRTLMNESKLLIEQRDKFKDEFTLAKMIIKTTCAGKSYADKALRLKGHSLEDFEEDSKKFIEIYKNIRSDIQKLPVPLADDCCRITASSTICDLQDKGFLDLLGTNKMEFMKEFTLTGIPIRIYVSSSLDLNPWILQIRDILISPYEILSQRALEFGANSKSQDKFGNIMLKDGDHSTRFNAVIPIFPEGTVKTLKPLLTTKIFSMCCTFAILKNVYIIDYECHVAALACAWIKTIQDYKKEDRPEFIIKRINSIIETFDIYRDRKSLKAYAKCLVTNPNQALVTRSADKFEEATIECRSLVKPAFILFMYEDSLKPTESKKSHILELMLVEYLGRCITNLTSKTPYSTIFIEDFGKKRNDLYNDICANAINALVSEEKDPLRDFYTPDQMVKHVRRKLRSSLMKVLTNAIQEIDICATVDVSKYKNRSSCGYITIESLKCWAKEMNISDFEHKFSSSKMRTYLIHAITHRHSKDRMFSSLMSEFLSEEFLFKRIIEENLREIKKISLAMVSGKVHRNWYGYYHDAHHVLVSPMTKPEIIEAAVKVGVEVNEETFDKVYKYRSNVGLLRNACMAAKCPHFLQPRKDFNEHLSVERKFNGFTHKVHTILSTQYKSETDTLMNEIYKDEKPFDWASTSTEAYCSIDRNMVNDNLPILKSEYSKYHGN